MSGSIVSTGESKVWVENIGEGTPLVYLHGIADLHGIEEIPMSFHTLLGQRINLIAPAHPGCAKSEENENIDTIEDVVFHYLRLFDSLDLNTFALAGSSFGAWIAAEIAVRHPERVEKLVLIGPTGLSVAGHYIEDIFWYAQPDDGVRYDKLRNLLFSEARSEVGLRMFPDKKDAIDREIAKYKVFRFANLIGFKPPYLHNPKLRSRLDRYKKSVLIIWGKQDSLVPQSHVEAYKATFPRGKLITIKYCGHSLIAEDPKTIAKTVETFITE